MNIVLNNVNEKAVEVAVELLEKILSNNERFTLRDHTLYPEVMELSNQLKDALNFWPPDVDEDIIRGRVSR